MRSGAQLDLAGQVPQGVSIVVGENQSPKQRGGYRLAKAEAKAIYALVRQTDSLLVLASHNETVNALRAFFGRQLPIWEGHVREGLSVLIGMVQEHKGDAVKIKEGPLESFEGVVDEVIPAKGMVRVIVTIFGRATPVELEYWQIEGV